MRVENPVSDMLWEGSPLPAPKVKNSQFPERAGRMPRPVESGIAKRPLQQVKP